MKTFLKSNTALFLLIVVAIGVVVFSFKNISQVTAQSPSNYTAYTIGGLTGKAYAENIGDITFNTSSYDRVSVNPNTGLLSGYAWNDNIGWIRFGNLGTTPSVSGASTGQAKYNFSNGTLTGWARVCSVFDSGCSGALKDNIYRGGWDGWISLASSAFQSQSGGGTGAVAYAQGNPTYGVVFNNTDGIGSGWAWGGTTEANANFPGSGSQKDRNAAIIGWINFTGVNLTLKPSVNLSANPSEFAYNEQAYLDQTNPTEPSSGPFKLTWTTSYATSCPSSGTSFASLGSASNVTNSTWGGSKAINNTIGEDVTFTLGPNPGPKPPKSKATFTITCRGIGSGSPASAYERTASATVLRGDIPPESVPSGPRKFEEF